MKYYRKESKRDKENFENNNINERENKLINEREKETTKRTSRTIIWMK